MFVPQARRLYYTKLATLSQQFDRVKRLIKGFINQIMKNPLFAANSEGFIKKHISR